MAKVPAKMDAVCGSDGITYSNQCLFKHYKCITGVVIIKASKGKVNYFSGIVRLFKCVGKKACVYHSFYHFLLIFYKKNDKSP
jgi:hypothetical protein